MRLTTVLGLVAGLGLVGGGGLGVYRVLKQDAEERVRIDALRKVRAEADKATPLIASGDYAGALWHLDLAYEGGARDTAVRFLIPWLETALDREVAALVHDAPITAVAYSPDGRRILTGGGDGSARLWDAASGTRLWALEGHRDQITAISWSPDGKRALTLGRDGSARLWDTEAGRELAVLRERSGVAAAPAPAVKGRAATAPTQGGDPAEPAELWIARLSPDGKRVLTLGSERGARLWDGETGALVTTLVPPVAKGEVPLALGAFSSDSRRIVTVAGSAAFLWDGQTGQLVAALRGHAERVKDATFSPDGTRVVTSSADQTAKLWDGKTGALVTTLEGHTGTVYSSSFTLAGGRAVMTISADGTARLWDSASGRSLFPPVGHPRYSQIMALSSDGGRMVIVSESDALELWNRILGNMRAQLEEKVPEGGVVTAFSPSGRRIVTGNPDGSVRIWDGRSGQPLVALRGHRGRVLAAAWSPDSGSIITAGADQTARIWRSRADRPPLPIEGHRNEVAALSFSRDGKRLVSASRDGTVYTWDTASGDRTAEFAGQRGALSDAFFATTAPGAPEHVVTVEPGGSGSAGRIPSTVRLWRVLAAGDADAGTQVAQLGGPLEYGQTLATSRDGRRAVSSGETQAELWALADGPGDGGTRRIAQLATAAQVAALSPDGKSAATAAEGAKSVRLWNGDTGAALHTLPVSEGEVRVLAYSPDGRLLAIGRSDAVVELWDAAGGQRLHTLSGHVGEVRGLRFGPGGERLLVSDGSERAWLWDTGAGQLAGALPKFTPRGFVSLAFSPDGTRIASVGEQVRIWDGRSGKMLALLAEKGEVFSTVAWSPDGKLLATGAQGGAVKLWDVHLEDRSPAELHRALMATPAYARTVEARRKASTSIPYDLRVPKPN